MTAKYPRKPVVPLQSIQTSSGVFTSLPLIDKNSVKYLAFEGGGGKGAAHLGAIWALRDLRVLRWAANEAGKVELEGVYGIAGSSAGAITAMLLASGYTLPELTQVTITLAKQPDEKDVTLPAWTDKYDRPIKKALKVCGMFDPPYMLSTEEPKELLSTRSELRLTALSSDGKPLGKLGEGKLVVEWDKRNEHDPRNKRLKYVSYCADPGMPDTNDIEGTALRPRQYGFVAQRVVELVLGVAGLIAHFVPVDILKKPPVNILIDDPGPYLLNFLEDGGIFSGCNARNRLDDLLADKTLVNGERKKNVTFAEHFLYHGIELVIAGTELTTGVSRYFSARLTPNFPVADAVRISMGFPGVYKPVRILYGPYAGLWADGGIANNIPLHAFDEPGQTISPEVLGLRLELDDSFGSKDPQSGKSNQYGGFSILGAIKNLLWDSGEWSQIRSDDDRARSIQLDIQAQGPGEKKDKTYELGLLDFSPDINTINAVCNKAYRTVMVRFGEISREPQGVLPGLG